MSRSTDRQNSLIDSFLEKHSSACSPSGPDYAPENYLERYLGGSLESAGGDGLTCGTEEGRPGQAAQIIQSRSEALLDAFLATHLERRTASPPPLAAVETQSGGTEAELAIDREFYTSSLARVYIRQHKYEKALEIIRSIYLNYPNKSVYFADQINYLDKLIKINKTE